MSEPRLLTPDEEAQLDQSYRPALPDDAETWTARALRLECRELAMLLMESCPPSRARSLALTQLETAHLWMQHAITEP